MQFNINVVRPKKYTDTLNYKQIKQCDMSYRNEHLVQLEKKEAECLFKSVLSHLGYFQEILGVIERSLKRPSTLNLVCVMKLQYMNIFIFLLQEHTQYNTFSSK